MGDSKNTRDVNNYRLGKLTEAVDGVREEIKEVRDNGKNILQMVAKQNDDITEIKIEQGKFVEKMNSFMEKHSGHESRLSGVEKNQMRTIAASLLVGSLGGNVPPWLIKLIGGIS